METLRVDRTVEAALLTLRQQLSRRGDDGLRRAARAFQLADFDGSQHLDREEFEEAMQYAGMFVKSHEVSALLKYFDTDRDGTVDYVEFLRGLRGELPESRRKVIERAFMKLDRDGSGAVTISDVKGVINAAEHPLVKAGEVTEEAILKAFLDSFDESKDNRVTLDEFTNYYHDVSAGIPEEGVFEAMVERIYGLKSTAVSGADAEKVHRLEALLTEKVRQKCSSTQSPKTRLTIVFQHEDTDRTGGVTVDEMAKVLSRLGVDVHRKVVLLFFKMYDPEATGELQYADYIRRLYPDE